MVPRYYVVLFDKDDFFYLIGVIIIALFQSRQGHHKLLSSTLCSSFTRILLLHKSPKMMKAANNERLHSHGPDEFILLSFSQETFVLYF